MFSELLTPSVLIDLPRLDANIQRVQSVCAAHGVELRPHVKTHKLVPVARRQLAAGAAGFTCAKVGEAEALLPAFKDHDGPREFFIAHSLTDPHHAPRLRVLAQALDDLVVACTSEAHRPAISELARACGSPLAVMMAVDTGLHREGTRGLEAAVTLARAIEADPWLELRGLYSHEGHFYTIPPAEREAELTTWHAKFSAVHDAVEAALGREILLWPGCSVTASTVATMPDVDAVRPGAYVFGDLFLSEINQVLTVEQCALHVLATVVDRPEPGLALIDAGSKTFSSDRTPEGVYAKSGTLAVTRVSEEHGFVTGEGVDRLRVGDRLQFLPAHVCPVLNLASEVVAVDAETVVERWPVEARGRTR